MIVSDLPSPAEAFSRGEQASQGFAQAGNRCPLFGIMLYAIPAGNGYPAFGGASRLIRVRASMRLVSEFRKKKAGMERFIADPVKSFRVMALLARQPVEPGTGGSPGPGGILRQPTTPPDHGGQGNDQLITSLTPSQGRSADGTIHR